VVVGIVVEVEVAAAAAAMSLLRSRDSDQGRIAADGLGFAAVCGRGGGKPRCSIMHECKPASRAASERIEADGYCVSLAEGTQYESGGAGRRDQVEMTGPPRVG
jgi:hypothetical protein